MKKFALIFFLYPVFFVNAQNGNSFLSGSESPAILIKETIFESSELISFLTRAENTLEKKSSLDEDLLMEFQSLSAEFDRIVSAEEIEIISRFFEISKRITDREYEKLQKQAERYRRRHERDVLGKQIAGGSLGCALGAAVCFGAAVVPYAEYTGAYETAEAVSARKKTVACLVPGALLSAAAGGLLISSIVLWGTGDRPEENRALLEETKIRLKGVLLKRGSFL